MGPHPPSDLPPTCSKPLAVEKGPPHVGGRLPVRRPCRHLCLCVLETLSASPRAGGASGRALGWVSFVQAALFTYGPGAAVPPSTRTRVCPDPTAFLMSESNRVMCGAIHPKDPLPTRAVVRHVWAQNATLLVSGPPQAYGSDAQGEAVIQADQAPQGLLGLLPSESVSQVCEMLLGLLSQQAGWRKEQRPLSRTLCGAGEGTF